MTGTAKVQLDATEVRNLFEQVGAPAETVDSFVEIFESAVATQVASQVEVQLAEKVAELEQKHEQHINELNEKAEEYKGLILQEHEAKLNSYIEHFATQFADENKPVIESNVRANMFESLMTGMIALLKEHNIELGEDKVDVLAVAESKLSETETALAESQAQVIELTRQINEGKREEIIAAAVADLTESQVEKVRGLLSDVVYTENFADKVQRVVEALAKPATVKTETTEVNTEVTETIVESAPADARMASYLAAAKGKASRFR